MITVQKRIVYKSYGDVITVKPIGDVHYGSKFCDVRAFREHLGDPNDKNTYYFGLGDLFDAVCTTDWRYMKSGDDLEGDDLLDQAKDDMEEILKPYKDRIICMGIGNHEKAVLKKANTNMVKDLCKRLDVPYVGFSFFIKLILSKWDGKRHHTTRAVTFRVHHGWGSGSRTQGYPLTKYAHDIKNYEADIYCYGHDHQRKSDYNVVIAPRGDGIIAKKRYLALCGTFLKTLSKGTDSGYGEDAGFPPTAVGGLSIAISPQRKGFKVEIT